jgi:hypothetical protein
MEDKYLSANRLENAGLLTIWNKILIWTVEFDNAAVKELRKLDRQAQQEILRYFREPIPLIKTPAALVNHLRVT